MVTPSPKEGGWGIVVVIASHLCFMIMVGIRRCGSVLFVSWTNEFGSSAGETAIVQSILSSVTSCSGMIGGLMTVRYGCRLSGMFGGALGCVGLFCSYWVQSLYQLYVTNVIIGLGFGIASNATVVVVANYFKKEYKIANAVSYAGRGTGIMIVPPLLQFLLDKFGWRGAMLISCGMVANVVACSALFRPIRVIKRPDDLLTSTVEDSNDLAAREANVNVVASNGDDRFCTDVDEVVVRVDTASIDAEGDTNRSYSSPRHSGKSNLVLKKLWTNLGLHLLTKSYRFTMLCLLSLEFNAPYTGFILFIIPRAISVGITPSKASFLLTAHGIGGVIGTLLNGILANRRISSQKLLTFCLVLCGISSLIVRAEDYRFLLTASFLQGFSSGACLATPYVLIRQYVGLRYLAVGSGLNHFFMGIGDLTGPIITGWLFDETASYAIVFYVIAGTYFMCAIQSCLFSLLKRVEPGIEIKDK